MSRRNRLTTSVLAAASLCALLGLPSIGAAGDDGGTTLEMLAVQSASTPAQHQALASYYREKAAAARAEVTMHRKMSASYGGRKAGADTYMKSHCDSLADAAEKSAKDYDALAAYHDSEAKTQSEKK